MFRQTIFALTVFTALFAIAPEAEAHRRNFRHTHRRPVVVKKAPRVVVAVPGPRVVVAAKPACDKWVVGHWVWAPRAGYRWIPGHWTGC